MPNAGCQAGLNHERKRQTGRAANDAGGTYDESPITGTWLLAKGLFPAKTYGA
jgi:hypothetical protein